MSGFVKSIFGKPTTTTTDTTNSQSGSTSNNYFNDPGYQQFLAGYNGSAAAASGADVDPNAYTDRAARQQAGVAASVAPGMAAANNAAAGTTYNATSYKPYMSEYTGQVTDALKTQYADMMKQAGQVVNGDLTKAGAFGNSNNNVARANALAPMVNQANTKLAEVQQQGFNTANQNAQAAGSFTLQGANAAGQLANAQTGANTALGNIGQAQFGQQVAAEMLPAQVQNQFLQGYNQVGNMAGTNYTGSSTGHSDSEKVESISPFQAIMGTAGTVASMFSDKNVKDNIAPIGETYDGQPIYRYNYKGDPTTQIGLIAQDVERSHPNAVGEVGGIKTVNYDHATRDAAKRGGFASGGEVIDLDPILEGYFLSQQQGRPGRAEGGEVDYDPRLEWINGPNKFSDPRKYDDLRSGYIPSTVDRVVDAVSLPAKLATAVAMQPYRAGDALGDALIDPSLENVTNAGMQSGMAAFQPMKALGALGAGYATALAKDSGLGLPSFTREANAQGADDPLDKESRDRLKLLQTKAKKTDLSRAEREEQNAYLARIATADRLKLEAKLAAENRAGNVESDVERSKKLAAQQEYSSAVDRAEAAKATELARDRRFSETETGKIWDKTGGLAPAALGVGLGALSRASTGGGTFMKDYGLPVLAGTIAGAASSNVPLAYNSIWTEPDNPERKAFSAYARELPEGHPKKIESEKYALGLPEKNPLQRSASEELYNPTKAAERMLFGAVEGAGGGLAGADLMKMPRRLVEGVAGLKGMAQKGYYKGEGDAATARAALQDVRRTGDEARLLEQASGPVEASSVRSLEAPASQAWSMPVGQIPAATPGQMPVPLPMSSPAIEAAKEARKLSRPASLPMQRPESKLIEAPSSQRPALSSAPDGYQVPDTHSWDDRLKGSKVRNKATGNFDSMEHARPVKSKPSTSLADKSKEKLEKDKGGRWFGGLVDRFSSGGRASYQDAKAIREPVIVGGVVGHTGGRTDAKPVSVPSGSFVIPADCVGSLGEGNSLAGIKKLEQMFGKPDSAKYAAGGGASAVPIKISDGEFVLSPDQVAQLGGGSQDQGHRILDKLVMKLRQDHIKTLKSLPGPAQS